MDPNVTSAIISDLSLREGIVKWMYLDTVGLVTVGIGNMLATVDDAMALPFIFNSVAAAHDRIEMAYNAVKGMLPGKLPDYYLSNVRNCVKLPDGEAEDLCRNRIETEYYPECTQLFSGFESYPPNAIRALVDMCYNLGAGALAKFTNLRAACARGGWRTAAVESHVSTSRDSRNQWRYDLLKSCDATLVT